MHKSVAFLLVFGDDDDGAVVGWLVVFVAEKAI
jgi:hypothetical protein